MPSKLALEHRRRQEKEAEETEMWSNIESQIEIEESAKRNIEMKQKQKQQLAGKSLDAESSVEVWNKLGIDAPIKPVKREEPPPIIIDKDNDIASNNDSEELVPKEPDWELVDKMAKLSEPVEGVPEAPDLQELSNPDSDDENQSTQTEAGWADDWWYRHFSAHSIRSSEMQEAHP